MTIRDTDLLPFVGSVGRHFAIGCGSDSDCSTGRFNDVGYRSHEPEYTGIKFQIKCFRFPYRKYFQFLCFRHEGAGGDCAGGWSVGVVAVGAVALGRLVTFATANVARQTHSPRPHPTLSPTSAGDGWLTVFWIFFPDWIDMPAVLEIYSR